MAAYFVRARKPRASRPLDMLFVADAPSPEEAIELVKRLVAPDTNLEATGEQLSGAAVAAIRLKPGQAKLA